MRKIIKSRLGPADFCVSKKRALLAFALFPPAWGGSSPLTLSKLLSRKQRPAQPARFTLIELLVVIAIISVLAALLLPAIGRARESGRRVLCRGNLGQVTLSTIMYADDYGRLYDSKVVQEYTLENAGNFGDEFQCVLYFASNEYEIGTDVWGCPSDPERGLLLPTLAKHGLHAANGSRTYASYAPNFGFYVSPFVAPQGVPHIYRHVGWFHTQRIYTTNNNPAPAVRIEDLTDPSRTMSWGDVAGRPQSGTPPHYKDYTHTMLHYRVGSYGRVMDRHLGRANVGYLDGHVGGGTAGDFFASPLFGTAGKADEIRLEHFSVWK